ncbi:MAG: outer membrane lipoprotein-sorting protein [bacterium]|nr:outer membrane lipoprotein-sorting protein [bacterium]MCP5065681.1 outer membrane lipoprotein-sorting protein [bacterium]
MVKRFAIALLAATAWAGTAGAETLPDGAEVARRINARDDGSSAQRTLEMELIDKSGHTRKRSARLLRRWFGKEKRLALFYLSPATIEDTAFLVHDFPEPGRDDAQWLYLPALRKVRRIAARDRGKDFLGTDMSYEDMKNETKVSAGDHHWTTLREEACGDTSCLVVEAVPLDEDMAQAVGYGKVTYWVDRTTWIARRAEYEDTAGRPKKSAQISEIRQVDGIWTAHRIEVTNRKSGHRTVFHVSDVDYATEIDADLFTERSLRRGVR